jgi:16S rRNA (cytosine967-C5)-methyltransferase
MKTNKIDVTNALTDCGYVVLPSYASNSGLSIENGGSIERNPLFNKGLITPQDESAILVSEALDLSKDMIVMDMCSAPGGKTTNIGEILCNTGRIYAFDLYEKKLNLIKENASRLGLTNIICKKSDSTKYQEEFANLADRVLLDVPCSGLGIIRKKPEIKWFKNEKDLVEIVKTQRLILINSAKYVKENGILFYSTCTLNKKENEENINWFLENHKDFVLDKLDFGALPNIVYNPLGSVTILPNEFMDGFFMAKIRRKSGCNN